MNDLAVENDHTESVISETADGEVVTGKIEPDMVLRQAGLSCGSMSC